MMRTYFFITILFTAVGYANPPHGNTTLLLSFDGKGTAMAWDAGVVAALFERIKPGRITETLFVGSSSGSIAASYFACRGLNATSIADIQTESKKFPKDVLDESSSTKAMQLTLGIPGEVGLEGINPITDMATQNRTCLPKHPLLIASGNLDVVEGRNEKPFSGRRDRTFNKGTYELIEKEKNLGKVCTYFVNEPMAKILESVPGKERLCDLRHIRTAKDLYDAIVASIAEPTYFYPPVESDLSQIESAFPLPAKRHYGGGFVMNSPVQDVKRARPNAWTVGTGRTTYTRLQNRMILNWFSFPMNETLLNQRWWFDEQVVLSKAEWDGLYEKKTTTTDQVARGYAKAVMCFDGAGCLPKLNEKPLFSGDASGNPMDELRGRGIKALF